MDFTYVCMTDFIFPLVVELIIAGVVWWYLQRPCLRVKVICIGSVKFYPTPKTDQNILPLPIFTHSIVIWNDGLVPLKNIQVLHNIDVGFDAKNNVGNESSIGVGIWPTANESFIKNGTIIAFDSLAPRETKTINYIYPSNLQYNFIHPVAETGLPMVRSDQVLARPERKIPLWLIWIVCGFIVIGLWNTTQFVAKKLFIECTGSPVLSEVLKNEC